jgi:PTH1 family peptidyl-tRNA hydrolase
MTLIAGLGNPGKKFKNTRHNIGFEVIDRLKKEKGFPGFRLSKKFQAKISRGSLNKKKVLLIKPQTFMNNSGESLKKLTSFYKKKNLIVIHDDIDLPLGKIKISREKGSAGHKGVQSIIDKLKTQDFTRFRVGILPKKEKPEELERFVLKKFTKEEKKIIKEAIKKIIPEIEKFLKIKKVKNKVLT